jgi:hypothetical protein
VIDNRAVHEAKGNMDEKGDSTVKTSGETIKLLLVSRINEFHA